MAKKPKTKWTFTGWMGKTGPRWYRLGSFKCLAPIWQRKGTTFCWTKNDWPPRKVRVTVEVIE